MKSSILPKFLGAAALVATATAPAFAQAPTKAQAASSNPAAAPAAAPAPAPVPVTPEARAAIKELFDVMNTRENLGKTFGAMAQTLRPQMAQAMNVQIETNTTLSADQKAKMRQNMDAPFNATVKDAEGIVTNPKLVDETMERMVSIYARLYTVPEIKQLTTFYKSPLGAKTLTTMPQAINESLQAGISIFQPRLAALMEKTMKAQFDLATKK